MYNWRWRQAKGACSVLYQSHSPTNVWGSTECPFENSLHVRQLIFELAWYDRVASSSLLLVAPTTNATLVQGPALIFQINALKLLRNMPRSITTPARTVMLQSVLLRFQMPATRGKTVSYASPSFLHLTTFPRSVFQFLNWGSYKSRSPVRHISAAEILAASDALDRTASLRSSFELILETNLEAWGLVDSKDLYRLLITQQISVDRFVHGDVNCIRFVFWTTFSGTGWILGSCNSEDTGTKQNSTFTESVMLMIATAKILTDMSQWQTKASERILG